MHRSLGDRLLLALCIVAVSHVSSTAVMAQQPRVTGPYDTSFAIPTFEGHDGTKDPSALRIVHDFLRESNIEGSRSMTCEGAFAIGESSSAVEGHAKLILDTGNRFRLDIETLSGTTSSRIDGMSGVLQRGDASLVNIPIETAAAGLIVTPWALSQSLPDFQTSIRDGGVSLVDGESLLKVVFRRPVCGLPGCPDYLQKRSLTIDLYFDSRSHLLIKSVDEVRPSEASLAKALRVVTYSDYRRVGQSLIPHSYIETLNGQASWSFEVSSISFSDSHDASYFHF